MSYLAKTTSKGHDYYSLMESYREDGKVKHRTILKIGRLSNLCALLPETLRAGPADKFQTWPPDISDLSFQFDPVRCREHGPAFLLYSVAEWLDIMPLMESIFPPNTANDVQRPVTLLLSAIHRACHPGSMSAFSDWFRGTSLPDYLHLEPDVFTAQHIWEQMDGITDEQIKAFEKAVFSRILELFPEVKEALDHLSSDFTNYYSYICNQKFRCTIAQLGHSKEGRTGQKIFNVAILLSPLLGIPIATMVYEGNKNDKTALKEFYSELKTRLEGIVDSENVTFIFDGGGASEETLKQMPGHFITRGSLHSAPELYDIPLSEYKEIELEDGSKVTAYRTKAMQYGEERTVVISLSEQLKAGQIAALDKRIKSFSSKIDEMNKMLANPRATSDKRLTAIEAKVKELLESGRSYLDEFMDIQYVYTETQDPVITRQYKKLLEKKKKELKKTADPQAEVPSSFEMEINGIIIRKPEDIPTTKIVTSIQYKVNETKKQQTIDRYYGKHVITTDHDSWSTQRILSVYRDQEYIENFFRDTKDTAHFSVRPAFHWTDQKLKVHVMICYCGLSLCRVAVYLLKRDQNFTIPCSRLMSTLENVQECIIFLSINGQKIKPQKQLSEMDKKTQETWEKVLAITKYMKEHPLSTK